MKSSAETKDIDIAIVLMQSELDPVPKDSVNPHFKSKYADLASCKGVAKPLLAKNKLGVIQGVVIEGDSVGVVTRLIHASGQWYESLTSCKPRNLSPQDVGSAITYMRRYGFCAMIGLVADEDTDGNAPPTPMDAKSAPMNVFDMNNEAHKTQIKKFFNDKKIDSSVWREIAEALHGKPWSELQGAVDFVLGR